MIAAVVALMIATLAAGERQPLISFVDRTDDTRELEEIEHRLAKAWLTGGRQFVEATLSEDWSVIDAAGRVFKKQQVIAEGFESHDRRLTSAELDDLRVRMFDDCAVVTGKSKVSGQYQGKEVSVVARFTDVFIRDKGRWQIVASQASRLTQ